MPTSAQSLQGLALTGGWTVVRHLPKNSKLSGGAFSESYLVENQDGEQAFLKALDFSLALRAADPARELQALTEAFNFERDLLMTCRSRRMSRVVTAITEGTVAVPNPPDVSVVQYLIFELADGDLRETADTAHEFEVAWLLRTLHQVALGLQQLHAEQIAHQDVKPSNVLLFPDQKGAKLGDLGRAAKLGSTPPHDTQSLQGDPTYAPPELAYGYTDPEWNRRRYGCDLYHLGSLIVFFFTGQGLTALLFAELPPIYWPRTWGGSYADVLPYVRDAFGKAINRFSNEIPDWLRPELTAMVRSLCDPDLSLRGHPKNRAKLVTQYSLERYISRLNALAARAEAGMLIKVGHP
jgi:serine/threonine protein kinase